MYTTGTFQGVRTFLLPLCFLLDSGPFSGLGVADGWYGVPGNVHQLQNTFGRAAIWTPEATLTMEDNRDALLPVADVKKDAVLGKPLGDGLDLPGILAAVARYYLHRALKEAHGNQTWAAQLVGLPNFQTFTNWTMRYGMGV